MVINITKKQNKEIDDIWFAWYPVISKSFNIYSGRVEKTIVWFRYVNRWISEDRNFRNYRILEK